MNFVDSIYQETKNIQTAIMTHPFTKGIGDGTLDKDSFKFFIEQDYLFLIEYSKLRAKRLNLAGPSYLFWAHKVYQFC